jgi:anti-sigma regulatory factor (Ser/Thr protein kinase)
VATVALSFQPAAEHVRTARLVAVAVARRAGLDEARLDEIRLAVGEVCARAVRRCREAGVTAAVLVELEDGGPVLDVVVTDRASAPENEDEFVALALVRGLADEVDVEEGPGGPGGVIRMSWSRAG